VTESVHPAGHRPTRIGVQLAPQHASIAQYRDAVLRAEDLGVDAVFNWDHFFPLTEPRGAEHYEAWTLLAAIAERTERVQFGPLVNCSSYRNPDLQADMARTVDHISGGRLILGLGAGWYEPDYADYGYEFGTVSSRHGVFVDALERIENRLPKLLPPPVRKIPILIGGGGEKKTLPTVARFADIWHVHADVQTFLRKNDIVIESAQRIGRDHQEIERAVAWTNSDDADRFADAGVTMFQVSVLASDGYDLAELKEALAWRDSRR
jgi:probable F420-dependent oxidoreductase